MILLQLIIGFLFGSYLYYLGYDVTTKEYWVLLALITAAGLVS